MWISEFKTRIFDTKNKSNSGDPENLINDEHFINQLLQIKKLKQFLFEEKVRFDPEKLTSIDLGLLNNLQYRSNGRSPSNGEWSLLDEKLSSLASYLNDDLRRKIRVRELGLFFRSMPLIFLSAAVLATICYPLQGIVFEKNSLSFNFVFLILVVAWTIAQGGLGACAFLLTQIAIVRADSQATKGTDQPSIIESILDITDRNILRTRILLGALFAFLIGLPISVRSIEIIYQSFYPKDDSSSLSASDLGLTLVPFLLGFSTNLVLTILNRSLLSIQTLFGISSHGR
jgi:hypothetical protein